MNLSAKEINVFSRYENGKTKPPLVLVKLLKVLDRHSDLLDEVKVAQYRTSRWNMAESSRLIENKFHRNRDNQSIEFRVVTFARFVENR